MAWFLWLALTIRTFSGTQLHYSVDTVRYFRHAYHGHGDRIYFMVGADAFLDIPMWKEYETLLGLCDFIVANRPGIRVEALRLVIPPDLIARPDAKRDAETPADQVVAHLKAICTEVEEQLYKHLHRSIEHREGYRSAEWALLDFGSFVVHVFSDQARRYYDLERLWRMAPKLEIPDEPGSPLRSQTLGDSQPPGEAYSK